MLRIRRIFRRRRRATSSILPITSPIENSTKSRSKPSVREKRCLRWTNVAVSALIPLVLGIGTAIITVQQIQTDSRRQTQERQLDDRNYQLQQDQANELHYQDVFKTYISDVSDTIFKQQQLGYTDEPVFIDNQTRVAYIRSQTLIALDDLDSQRKTRIFQFLYDNKLLPQISSSSSSLDLSGANFAYILISSSTYNKFIFRKLSLSSVDLSNGSFIDCDFLNGFSFSFSTMSDVKFTGSMFECRNDYRENIEFVEWMNIFFYHTLLIRADFRKTQLCDIVFNGTDLSYASFVDARFMNKIQIFGTNLASTDFSRVILSPTFSMTIINTNMIGSTIFENNDIKQALNKGQISMMNVILPNGTWLIDNMNLIENGNAEMNCLSSSNDTGFIRNWNSINSSVEQYPTVTNNTNSNESSLGKCYFNMTSIDKKVQISQLISLRNFSFFIDSSQAEYYLTADINCIGGILSIDITFQNDVDHISLYSNFYVNGTSAPQWLTYTYTDKIPISTHNFIIEFTRTDYQGLCYIDNVGLYIRQTK